MNEKQTKTLRFYLVLPLLVLPFVTIAFWLMGGGTVGEGVAVHKTGLNTSLPDAHNGKDSIRDKMSFYEQANADSARRSEQIRNDPNYKAQTVPPDTEQVEIREIKEIKVHSIRQRIKMPEYKEPAIEPVENYMPTQATRISKPVVDPDLEAINQTIEKLAALQNPAKPAEKVDPEIKRDNFSVKSTEEDDGTYFGKRLSPREKKQFFNDKISDKKSSASFSAIVPSTQILQAGSVIRLQLSQPITIDNAVLPNGTMVYGVSSIENERLFVHISSIQFANTIYPVALSVFDLDGVEGIHVPGSVSREVVKSAAEQSLQSVNVLSLDPSLKTQAVTAGVGAMKNLLSRKVKAVRVTIAGGYRVLLRDNKIN